MFEDGRWDIGGGDVFVELTDAADSDIAGGENGGGTGREPGGTGLAEEGAVEADEGAVDCLSSVGLASGISGGDVVDVVNKVESGVTILPTEGRLGDTIRGDDVGRDFSDIVETAAHDRDECWVVDDGEAEDTALVGANCCIVGEAEVDKAVLEVALANRGKRPSKISGSGVEVNVVTCLTPAGGASDGEIGPAGSWAICGVEEIRVARTRGGGPGIVSWSDTGKGLAERDPDTSDAEVGVCDGCFGAEECCVVLDTCETGGRCEVCNARTRDTSVSGDFTTMGSRFSTTGSNFPVERRRSGRLGFSFPLAAGFVCKGEEVGDFVTVVSDEVKDPFGPLGFS